LQAMGGAIDKTQPTLHSLFICVYVRVFAGVVGYSIWLVGMTYQV